MPFVIEKLDLLTLPYIVWLSFRYKGGWYVYWSRSLQSRTVRRFLGGILNLRQLRYDDFPGSYFATQDNASEFINDNFSNESKDAQAVLKYLQQLQNHRLMGVAFRKVLLETYTLKRIKAFTLAQSLSGLKGRPVVFLPNDNDSLVWLPAGLQEFMRSLQIPRGIRILNELRSRLDIAAAVWYAIFCAFYLIGQRGIRWSYPMIQRWGVGFDIHNWGIFWDRPYHGAFIYGKDLLSPRKILHVVRNRLSDGRVRRFYQRHGIPFIEASRLRIPIVYLFKRVLGQCVGGLSILGIRQMMAGQSGPFLWAASELLMHNLIRAEVLDLTAQTDVFVARDEYGVPHILRTLLYDLRGGKTLGFIHGDSPFREYTVTYLSFHTLCLQGEFVQTLLKENTTNTEKIASIGVGIYGLDRTYHYIQTKRFPARYKDLKKKYRLIGVFGSEYAEDSYLTREMTIQFYKTALSLLERYQDIALVIRPKTSEFDDPEFRALMKAAGPRAILETKAWSYKLIPILDLMLCVNFSTIGIEGLMCDKRVLYLDESGFKHNPYETYGVSLVTHTPEELLARIDEILTKDHYADPKTLELIKKRHGLQFDGRVGKRVRDEIYNLLEASRQRH